MLGEDEVAGVPSTEVHQENEFIPNNNTDPLPDYTSDWGPNLIRPTMLPVSYDERINSKHIFMFTIHPHSGLTGRWFVVSISCVNCKEMRQACNRTRPTCERCETGGKTCIWPSDPETTPWVKLGPPKCQKPSLKKNKNATETEAAPPAKKAKVDNASKSKSKRTLRPRPLTNHEGFPESMDFGSDYEYYASDQDSNAAPKGTIMKWRVSHPRSAAGSISHQGVLTKANVRGGTRRRGRGDWRRGNNLFRTDKGDDSADTWVAEDGALWNTVHPPSSSTQTAPPRDSPANRPRIWAGDRKELHELIPDLTRKTRNNVFWDYASLEPPMLFLGSDKWPEDSWTVEKNETRLRLTMMKEYVPKVQISQEARCIPVDFEADSEPEMTLVKDVTFPLFPGALPIDHDAFHHHNSSPAANLPGGPQDYGWNYDNKNIPGYWSNQYPGNHYTTALDYQQCICTASSYDFEEQISIMPPMSSERSTIPPSPSNSPCTYKDQPANSSACSNALASMALSNRHNRTSSLSTVFSGLDILSRAALSSSPLSLSSSTSHSDLEEGEIPDRDVTPPTSPPDQPSSPSDFASKVDPPNIEQSSVEGMEPSVSIEGLIPTQDAARSEAVSSHPANEASTEELQMTDLPPEISHLLECERYNIPLKLIAFRDSALLPFTLDEQYQAVFLGLFIMRTMKSQVLSRDATSGKARVAWFLELEWIPGGENLAPGTEQPLTPWWIPDSLEATSKPDAISPYTILPFYLRSNSYPPSDTSSSAVVSEVASRKGWHCLSCGKLNVQRHLCLQLCACGASNGMRAVGAMYVREPHSMGLSSHPADRIPEGVKCIVEDNISTDSSIDSRNAARSFVYSPSDIEPVKIYHIYTCNRPTMQVLPSDLFRDIQLQVPLEWQESKTQFLPGSYYTYLAGAGHGGNRAAIPWSNVPESVTLARDLMQSLCRQACKDDALDIDALTILAWHNTGNRKCYPVDSHESRAIFMCLGADVEFSLVPKCGLPTGEDNMLDMSIFRNAPAISTISAAKNLAPVVDGATETDEEDIPLSVQLRARNAQAASQPTSGAVASQKNRRRDEEILITLVHGDLLILSGDEFAWSLKRTGMSMLFIGISRKPTMP